MRNILRLLSFMLVASVFFFPAGAANASQGGDEKTALYQKFRDNIKTDQKTAYQLGKDYLQKYPEDKDQIAEYIKKFVTRYEKESRKLEVEQLIKDKKYNEAFAAGKQVLTDEPEHLKTLINLSWAGLVQATTAGSEPNPDAITYTRKTAQLIESGKKPDENQQFTAKDETLGWLNYALGIYSLKQNSPEAATHFHKAAQFEGFAKKDPQTYALLGASYVNGNYMKLSDEYKAKCTTPEAAATPECKTMLDNINQSVDRIIDAYARAVALAGSDAKYASKKSEWMTSLTEFYKFRNEGSDQGLNDKIAQVLSTPLPQPGSAPAAAPSTQAPAAQAPAAPAAPAASQPAGAQPAATAPPSSGGQTTKATP
jgi:hypothetical protein